MSATDIAFFTAIATVIPVFLVAYVIGVQKVIEAFGEGHSDSSAQYLQSVRNALEREDGRLHNVFGAVVALIAANTYEIATIFLFAIAVGMPAAAEYASLHALYVDHASSGAKTVGLIGALIAGAIVVAPLAVRVLKIYSPFGAYIGLLLITIRHLRPGKDRSDAEGHRRLDTD